MNKIAFLVFGIIVLAMSCTDDDAVVVTNQPKVLCDSLDVLYTNDVKPILDGAGCTGGYCHGGGIGGYTISDYATTKTTASDPKFLKAIRHEAGASPMPKGGTKLTDSQIEKIECWIQNGMKE
jgi:hypothetical protein